MHWGWPEPLKRPLLSSGTSGTAAANYYPAVIEANLSRIPLIILSADRPRSLVGTGANQTINQQDIFGYQVRYTRDMGIPEERTANLTQFLISAFQSTNGQNSAGLLENPPGPVHLNFPFDEPLLPNKINGVKISEITREIVKPQPVPAPELSSLSG